MKKLPIRGGMDPPFQAHLDVQKDQLPLLLPFIFLFLCSKNVVAKKMFSALDLARDKIIMRMVLAFKIWKVKVEFFFFCSFSTFLLSSYLSNVFIRKCYEMYFQETSQPFSSKMQCCFSFFSQSAKPKTLRGLWSLLVCQ